MATDSGAYMSASDAFSWRMERDPVLRPPVVVVAWLDRAPDWDALAALVDRTSRLVPSLRQRVIESPVPVIAPRWVNDPHFDLNWHLRRIRAPEPPLRDGVVQFARRLAMEAFDRARPLWELTLVEGLKGGEAALIVKMHHSLSDGVGGMRMLGVIADTKRKPRRQAAMPPPRDTAEPGKTAEPNEKAGPNEEAEPDENADQWTLLGQAAGLVTTELAGLARRGAETVVPALLRSVRDPVGFAHDGVAMARSLYRTAGPSSGALSPRMRDRATTRHLAMMEVSLDALKAAARAADGTVNDAYLAVITGGLRRYHERHGSPATSLRAVVPVNLRAKDETGWGNRITLQRLIVPAGEPDPEARMRALHSIITRARSEPSLPVSGVIAGTLNMLPVGYLGGILKHVDFLASNVTGPTAPVYLAGGKVTGLCAFGPTIGAAVNTTLLSYAGTCHIGVNIDTAAVPDPDVLLACLAEGLTEVTAVGAAALAAEHPADGPASGPADGPAGPVSKAPSAEGHAATRGGRKARREESTA